VHRITFELTPAQPDLRFGGKPSGTKEAFSGFQASSPLADVADRRNARLDIYRDFD
jgi:hypothetical protein